MCQAFLLIVETVLRDISYAITYDMSPLYVGQFTGDVNMSFGWFFLACAMFFVFAPKWRRRRGWGRGGEQWEPWGREGPRRERVRQTPEEKEKQEQREAQIEQLEARVAELESRLDFAERLLAPRRDPAMSPPAELR